jgi:hypothetical protein
MGEKPKSCQVVGDIDVFSILKDGVAGGARRLPQGKNRLPLPLERVCLKTRFAASGQGKPCNGFPT